MSKILEMLEMRACDAGLEFYLRDWQQRSVQLQHWSWDDALKGIGYMNGLLVAWPMPIIPTIDGEEERSGERRGRIGYRIGRFFKDGQAEGQRLKGRYDEIVESSRRRRCFWRFSDPHGEEARELFFRSC